MSDEDYDDELPLISVNPCVRESVDFFMPSADVLASQRAREEECEAELRQLRSQYESREVRLVEDSSSSESDGSLAAAVDALNVAAPPVEPAPYAADIVSILATQLATYDTDFLTSYLEILQTNNEDIIRTATNEISSNIECVIVDVVQTGGGRSEGEVAVVVSWLCAATVWAGPRVPAARQLLQAMLATATKQAAEAAGAALGAAVRSAGALVRAADAAHGSAAADALACALLRAALARLAPPPPNSPHTPQSQASLCVERVCARLRGAWLALAPAERHAALQLVGRAQWPHEGAGAARAVVREWLAVVAQPPPAHHRHSPEYLKVLVGASKLQIVFKVNP